MGAVVSPIKLRLHHSRFWSNIFFTHSENNYAYLMHKFSCLQSGLEGLVGFLNIPKTAPFNEFKEYNILTFTDLRVLNVGHRIYVLVSINFDPIIWRGSWFPYFKKIKRTRKSPYYKDRWVRRRIRTQLKSYVRWYQRRRKRALFRLKVSRKLLKNKWSSLIRRCRFRRPRIKEFQKKIAFIISRLYPGLANRKRKEAKRRKKQLQNQRLERALQPKKSKKALRLEREEEKKEVLKWKKIEAFQDKIRRRRAIGFARKEAYATRYSDIFSAIQLSSLQAGRVALINRERVFFMFFYIYPFLLFLKKIIANIVLWTFKQFSSAEVYFIRRDSFFYLNSKIVILGIKSLFYEVLHDPKAHRAIQYKKVFFRTLKKLFSYRRRREIHGFKIAFTGRFSRRERLTFIWRQAGRHLPISTVAAPLDYAIDYVWLKHGVCVIEVWMCRFNFKKRFKNGKIKKSYIHK